MKLISIAIPGHYRLASHLVVNAGEIAIEVVHMQDGQQHPACDATLDLGGRTIRGPFARNGTPVTDCTGIDSTTNGVSMNVGGGTIRSGGCRIRRPWPVPDDARRFRDRLGHLRRERP